MAGSGCALSRAPCAPPAPGSLRAGKTAVPPLGSRPPQPRPDPIRLVLGGRPSRLRLRSLDAVEVAVPRAPPGGGASSEKRQEAEPGPSGSSPLHPPTAGLLGAITGPWGQTSPPDPKRPAKLTPPSWR